MLGHTYDGEDCSAARALEVVGERWSLLILRNAMFRGYTRFAQFQGDLRIAPNVLTKRLDKFVSTGILERRPQPERPDHHDYVLTEMGQSLKPVVMTLSAWGDRWLTPGPAEFVHSACQATVEPTVHCPTCDAAVPPAEVTTKRVR
jgi:DNA-binding HxlR family transcriptional regulator